MNLDYAIIVKSQTRLEQLIKRFNTQSQAKFYIERNGGNFEDYVQEDRVFKESLEKLQTQLIRVIKNKTIERAYLPSYLRTSSLSQFPSPRSLRVALGKSG